MHGKHEVRHSLSGLFAHSVAMYYSLRVAEGGRKIAKIAKNK